MPLDRCSVGYKCMSVAMSIFSSTISLVPRYSGSSHTAALDSWLLLSPSLLSCHENLFPSLQITQELNLVTHFLCGTCAVDFRNAE